MIASAFSVVSPKEKYELVWSEEFDYTGSPDPAKWGFETGFIRNRELQYYTARKENARVERGVLVLETRKESIVNEGFVATTEKDWKKNREHATYSSASISTVGKAEFQYGKVVVRAKLSKGRGLWPAIWMLGTNRKDIGWPRCGEIDIMEHVGFDQDSIFGTVHTGAYNHTKGTQRGKRVFIAKPYDEFHDYAIEWTPEKIDFILGGTVYHTFSNPHLTTEEWPFDQSFYLKLNIAVGGDLGGKKGIDDSVFPSRMEVDFVRVYQLKKKSG